MNFLVKLSQNNKVIVPIVVVIGLAIFGGGYFINDNRQVARQEANTTTATSEVKQDELTTVESAEKSIEEVEATEAEDSDKLVGSEDSQSDKKEQLQYEELEMEVEYEGSIVTVEVETEKDGTCYIQYKSGKKDSFKSQETTNGQCRFTGVDADGKVMAKFISNDGFTKAVGYSD